MKINSLIIDTLRVSKAIFSYEFIIKTNKYNLQDIVDFINEEIDYSVQEVLPGFKDYEDVIPYRAFLEKGYVLIEPREFVVKFNDEDIEGGYRYISEHIIENVLKELEDNYMSLDVEKIALETDLLKIYTQSEALQKEIELEFDEVMQGITAGDVINAYYYYKHSAKNLKDTIEILKSNKKTKVLALDLGSMISKIISDQEVLKDKTYIQPINNTYLN